MNNYIQITNNIRYKVRADIAGIKPANPGKLPEIIEKNVYDFELFRRPFLFGLFGRKKWVYIGTFDSIGSGIEFCEKKGY